MTRIKFSLIALLLTSCSLRPITERRTARNLNNIESITTDLLRLSITAFTIDSLNNIQLKTNLKKLHVDNVEVYKHMHHEFRQDSLIVLSKHNFMLTYGEIVIDFKKAERDLTGVRGLKRIGTRTYFRKRKFAIS
jgi:hypothetical protein